MAVPELRSRRVLDYLKNNPDICNEIEKKIRDEVAKNSSLLDSHDDEDEAGRIEAEGADSADTSEKPAKKPSAESDEDDYAEFSPEDNGAFGVQGRHLQAGA